MTMLWLPYVLLFIALLAFFWRTTQVWRLSQELDILRGNLAKEGDEFRVAINTVFEDFDKTLYHYRPVIHDRAAMEARALYNLADDLRAMSNFVGYGERKGWGTAFDLFAHYRARLIVGRVALSASASDEFKEGMDKLVDDLKGFETMRTLLRTTIKGQAQSEPSDQRWPDLQATQLKVAGTQEQARKLMELLEQDKWRAVPQS